MENMHGKGNLCHVRPCLKFLDVIAQHAYVMSLMCTSTGVGGVLWNSREALKMF